MAPRRARAVQWLSNTVLRATTESRSSTIGHINLDRKQAGKPSARNGHARFDVAGAENQLTIRLMRHSQRKRGATDRSNLRSLASVLDPTDRGDCGNGGIIRSPIRAMVLPDQIGHVTSYKDTRRRFSCCGVLPRNNSAAPASRLQARRHGLRRALAQFLRELTLVSAEALVARCSRN